LSREKYILPRHITVKFYNAGDKEKIFKVFREEYDSDKGRGIEMWMAQWHHWLLENCNTHSKSQRNSFQFRIPCVSGIKAFLEMYFFKKTFAFYLGIVAHA
jgi:hypothetical protein